MPDSQLVHEPVWLATLSSAERAELTADDADLLAKPDVLIGGGGIVGLATAYYLTDLGASVPVYAKTHRSNPIPP